jgi:predicted lysophospholipase L1 biosynthesis ABC-type transport system permease subunit
MATDLTELELKARELEIKREQLAFERTKLFVEFAKFGFGGTLTAAVGGIILLFCLAALSAFSTYKIDSWVLVVFALVIMVGSVAFGYLSLWELPKVGARIQKEQMEFSVGSAISGEDQKQKPSQ